VLYSWTPPKFVSFGRHARRYAGRVSKSVPKPLIG